LAADAEGSSRMAPNPIERRRLESYMARLAKTREDNLLADLRRETSLLPEARMQISPAQGQLLALLARMSGARRILELGVFTGYSSICLARALPPDGDLTACDVSEEWTDIARRYWKAAGLLSRITLRLGPAAQTLEALLEEDGEGSFDLAFIDADKSAYRVYFQGCRRLVRPGGLIILDNAFLGGKVALDGPHSAAPRVVSELTAEVFGDPLLEPVILPLGDGVLVVRRQPV